VTVDALELAPRARMHGKDDGALGLDARDDIEERTQRLLRVDVARSVQGEQAVAARLHARVVRMEDSRARVL